jgi:hypothetical protein
VTKIQRNKIIINLLKTLIAYFLKIN